MANELVYEVVRHPRRRRVGIRVYPDLTVKVLAPLRYSLKHIEQFVVQHEQWIYRQLEGLKRQFVPPFLFDQAPSLFYLGQDYDIRMVSYHGSIREADAVIFQDRAFWFMISADVLADQRHLYMKTCFEFWLRAQADHYLRQRVLYYSSLLRLYPNQIRVKKQSSRWGSCSTKGNLNFNFLLMMTTPKVIDYVVVHELCHLKFMNHSVQFWDAVRVLVPDYLQLKKDLRQFQARMIRF